MHAYDITLLGYLLLGEYTYTCMHMYTGTYDPLCFYPFDFFFPGAVHGDHFSFLMGQRHIVNSSQLLGYFTWYMYFLYYI